MQDVYKRQVKIKGDVNGQEEDWLLLFKNETHNHPTAVSYTHLILLLCNKNWISLL